MDLKIFPFNKTLFKKDWKMTRWVVYIVAIMLFFTMTMGVISVNSNYQKLLKDVKENPEDYGDFDVKEYGESLKGYIKNRFKFLSGMESFLIIFMPIAIAALLFGEEKRRKTFDVLATMPFTRREIFFNKLIVAIINNILPIIINALIMAIALALGDGLQDFYSIDLVRSWLGANIFRTFITLGFSFLFATLTGTTISQVVLTMIFFVFPCGFMGLIDFNMDIWGYGFQVIEEYFNSVIKYTLPFIVSSIDNIPIAFHLISGILMFIFSKILFDRNKLERNGETLEFEGLETFFKVGVSICVGLLMGPIFGGINQDYSVLIIIGYVVGVVLGWLAANYSIRLNKGKA